MLRVHDLHVWTLSSGTVALSAHLEIRNLADWPDILAAARQAMDAATASATSPCSPKCWPCNRSCAVSGPLAPTARRRETRRFQAIGDETFTLTAAPVPHAHAMFLTWLAASG